MSRITFIWTLFVIATINKLEIYQRDVKIAFLNGDLDKEVYMEQLERFVYFLPFLFLFIIPSFAISLKTILKYTLEFLLINIY
jgi:hypothetical protein